MRRFWFFAALFAWCTPAHALLRTWPSPTCSTTLQACIDGSVSGDELVIETLATINEDLTVSKSLDLHSVGYSATLGNGRSLSINALNDGVAIKVRNLRLSGPVVATIGSANAAHTQSVELRGLQIRPVAGTTNPVRFVAAAGTLSTYSATLAQSRVFEMADPGSPTSVAVRFEHVQAGGTPALNLLDNQIMAWHDGVHFSVYAADGNALAHGNRIGRYRRPRASAPDTIGLQMLSGVASGAAARMRAQRNQIFHFGTGLRLWAQGALDAGVRNNTIAWIRNDGIRVERVAPATLGGRIANNILTGIDSCALFYSGAPSATADYNLYQGNALNQCGSAAAGANDRSGNPRFVGAYDFRLQETSPARDVGSNNDQPQVPILLVLVPTPDYDQRAGRVGGTVDIGAHEFSYDGSFAHDTLPINVSGNLTQLFPAPIPLLSSDLLQVAAFNNGNLKGMPPAADAHLGTWWNGSVWTLFHQAGGSVPMPTERRFHVLLNLDANPNLLHVAQAGNTTGHLSTLDHAALNNTPSALPIVTQRFNPNSIYNNSSLGVWYDGSRWRVFNQFDGAAAPPIPLGAAFSVLIPNPLFAPGNYAFRATATITHRSIPLDHPWLNETPCALPQATASYNPNSVYVASSVLLSLGSGGVNGDQSAWALVRGDGLDIPAGASYHVLVDPQQSRRCTEDLLFVSDIE